MRNLRVYIVLATTFGAGAVLHAETSATAARDSQRLAGCMLAMDVECVVAHSHAESYRKFGQSPERIRAKQASVFEGYRALRAKYIRFEASAPWEVFKGDGRSYVFVPYVSELRVNGRDRAPLIAYFIGISEDGEATWKFFDAAAVTAQDIRVIIPSYNGRTLPPRIPKLTVGFDH